MKMNKLSIGQRIKLEQILPFLRKTDKILDLGCGSMWLTKELRKRGYTCFAFDLDYPADIVGDVKTYPFKRDEYDIVIALEMIEHVNCFPEIKKMLKKDGLLILSTPVPHFDFLCWFNEQIGFFQKRTSPHTNLFYLKSVPFKPLIEKILFGIVQFGVYRR